MPYNGVAFDGFYSGIPCLHCSDRCLADRVKVSQRLYCMKSIFFGIPDESTDTV